MAISDERRREIIEEEEIRAKVRMKYEQKSSGIAGVLSTVVPGLGQIYNGQFGKGFCFSFIVLVSILLISSGVTFWVKGGIPSFKGKSAIIMKTEQQEEVKMDESGVIIEEGTEENEKEEVPSGVVPKLPLTFIVVGLVGLVSGWSFARKDAIKTAKLLNRSY